MMHRKMKVIRFKQSGKFYDHIYIETNKEYMFEISEEVRRQINKGELSDSFDYLIMGDEHPNGFPVLIKIVNLKKGL